MDGYRVEFFVADDDGEEKEFLELNEKDTNQWKKDLEARALSEYYNKKVKVSDKKI